MNKIINTSKSANFTTSNDIKRTNIVTSKLRRLQIEENILLQSLEKLDRKGHYVVEPDLSNNNWDCEKMLRGLKDSYLKIKNLLDDVKTVACSQELLAELEIEDIKKKVLELESTLKNFKVYLNSELSFLKTVEQDLAKKVEETNCKENNNMVRKRSKTLSTNYNQVVPSPVRLLITSPFKCTEVQEFQDFMKSSPNRYGGWDEYHHSLFIKYWQKYFGDTDEAFAENIALENFIDEALPKLQGINKECLISHIEWYKKFLTLKCQQQQAIDKWKRNRSIRKLPKKELMKNLKPDSVTNNLTSNADDVPDFDQAESSKKRQIFDMRKSMKQAKMYHKVLEQDDIERLRRPTKQWLSRNYEFEQKTQEFNSIENLEKLCIPVWRQYLTLN